MTYLLDVNSLVALGLAHHEFHRRMTAWVKAEPNLALATCPITELGFVQVIAQSIDYGFTVAQARTYLVRLKRSKALALSFIPDDHDIAHLPGWVKLPNQATEGHLAQLAVAHGAVLATLDERSRDAFLIPR